MYTCGGFILIFGKTNTFTYVSVHRKSLYIKFAPLHNFHFLTSWSRLSIDFQTCVWSNPIFTYMPSRDLIFPQQLIQVNILPLGKCFLLLASVSLWVSHCFSSNLSVSFVSSFPESRAFLIAQLAKNLPAMQETPFQFLGWEDPLEKGLANQSSFLWLPWWPRQ